ncbi:MAG: SAM-dependent methyltransferase [Rhodothermales bacterium]|jgi:SAM-dependent methyltransferase
MTDQDSAAWNPDWEEQLYGSGKHLNRYPFELVVSQLLSRFPDRTEAPSLLEVGCGAGNNLWFAAREGFQVAGIDGSQSAVVYARDRFAREGLQGDLRVGDFSQLPWTDASFDIVVDRKSITHNRQVHVRMAFQEAARVLRPGGLLVSELYSSQHPERKRGRDLGDGSADQFPEDSYFRPVGLTRFFSEGDLKALLESDFQLLQLEHILISDALAGTPRTAYWQAVAKKR